MFCQTGTAVNNSPGDEQAIALPCRRWSCDHCRPMRQAEVRALARAGSPTLMVTLTSQPDQTRSQDEQACDLVRAWRLIGKRYRRQFHVPRLPYLAVVEETKAGQPHLHILCRERFIDHKWLSEALKSITGAYIVWLTALRTVSKGANYVAKYLGKDPHHYAGCKRYWRSQDWVKDPDAWAERKRKRPGVWTRTLDTVFQVAKSFKRQGFEVIWITSDKAVFRRKDTELAIPSEALEWADAEADRLAGLVG